METKSRYDAIAGLEEKKRHLIRERDGFKDTIKMKERAIKELKRELEDKEEELEDYKTSVKDKEATIRELIESIDDGLRRLGELSKSQSQKKE